MVPVLDTTLPVTVPALVTFAKFDTFEVMLPVEEIAKVPPLIAVPPLYVFAPVSVSVPPTPFIVTPPAPEKAPFSVVAAVDVTANTPDKTPPLVSVRSLLPPMVEPPAPTLTLLLPSVADTVEVSVPPLRLRTPALNALVAAPAARVPPLSVVAPE
jgi:hypothetical protein